MENSVTLIRPLLIRWFGDRHYFSTLLTIAVPIMLQNFIMSSLNMVGVVFIGQLGDASVAAFGLANQVQFICQLTLFGIYSGAGIFSAQYWGKNKLNEVHNVLGFSLSVGVAVGIVFTLATFIIPRQIISVYSQDQQVINLGSSFLKLISPSFVFTAITFAYAYILRSVGEVKVPVIVSTIVLIFNTILSYLLIFGMLGFPEMGINGAAVSILAARIIECILLIFLIYRKKYPLAASLKQMFGFDTSFVRNLLLRVVPVTAQEIFWALGITTYNIIYARIGTESIATMNIVGSIEMLGMVTFFAIGTACSVVIGNLIGAEQYDLAQRYAGWTLRLVYISGAVSGVVIFILTPLILNLYKVSPIVIDYAKNVLTIVSLFLWLRAANVILIVGMFRGGGDTTFTFFLETGSMWCVGVLAAWVGAFVLGLPIYWVYLLIMMDETFKFFVSIMRYRSKKWIHNLVLST